MHNEFLQLRFPARLSTPLVITHVSVIPMDSERVLGEHTIVVQDGRIRAIGATNTIDVRGMQVVDGRSQYVLPGLADMYTHYREPAETPLYLAHGITCVRTSGSLFQLALGWAGARGEFPSPWMVAVSPSIDGIGPTGRTDMPHGVPLTEPERAEPLVQNYVRRGYRQIVPFSLLTAENLKALGQAAAGAGVGMVGNCPNSLSWEQAIEAGMTGFQQLHLMARDHMRREYQGQDYWDRFDPAPGTRLDFDSIRRLGALLADKQVWSIPTLVFHQRASRPIQESMADPTLRYVPRSTVDDWESTIVRWSHRGRVSVEEWRELARERAHAFHRVIAIFHEEGAPQLPGTDALNPYNVQGDSLHQELENFVAAGMRPYEALRCATSEAARFVGQTEQWGTLELGKRADLILVRNNPLQDIRAARQIEAMLVNGFYLTRSELDDLLQQRADLVSRPPSIPSTELAGAPGSANVVDEGGWVERIIGAEFGQLHYRHSRQPDGDWLVEERHAGADPRRHPLRRTVRLVLAPDLTVRSGVFDIESFVGTETGEVSWSEAGGYTVRYRAVDGYVSEKALASARMVPSEQLALSVVPRLIAERQACIVSALDAEADTPSRAEMSVAPVEDGQAWRLQVSRTGQRVEQTYRIAADGRLSRMDEMLPLLWPRELVPVEAQVRASARE
jgi:Amidohydrolase family